MAQKFALSTIFSEDGRVRMRPWFFAGLAAIAQGGCGAIVALDRAVLGYDRTAAASTSKLLLLNVARARHNQPMHFTGVSSIAATYKFGFSAGIGPAITGNQGALLLPMLGGSVEKNPTISIAPMQGDEFTQRLLTPFQEEKLTLLLRQGYDVDALLRLMGAEVRLDTANADQAIAHLNRPSDKEGYQVYRRVIAHLSSIQDRHALFVEPLRFEHSWTVPADKVTPESYLETFKDFLIVEDKQQHTFRISKRISGRIIITNYNPSILPSEEQLRLHQEAEEASSNDILLDIRAGHPGGEFPMHGRIRLRSFHEVLTFIGRGIEEEPEFDVAPDPRTPAISQNPTKTLDIVEASHAPSSELSVSHCGMHYFLAAERGYQWNRKAFSLLSQLFQMSVSALPQAGPAITISK